MLCLLSYLWVIQLVSHGMIVCYSLPNCFMYYYWVYIVCCHDAGMFQLVSPLMVVC